MITISTLKRKKCSGFTALHLASYSGHLEEVDLLVSHGAELDLQESTWGQTPLHLALNFPALVQYLLERGADSSIKDIEGFTPLEYALYINNSQAIELLQNIIYQD